MATRRSTYLKNFFSITAVLLSLAVLQSPLWRPAGAPRCVTTTEGGTVILEYEGQLDSATIFRKETATVSVPAPGRLAIHAHEPGKTSLLMRFKDGESRLYDVVVLPG